MVFGVFLGTFLPVVLLTVPVIYLSLVSQHFHLLFSVSLQIDGKKIDLPTLEGIVILNIGRLVKAGS